MRWLAFRAAVVVAGVYGSFLIFAQFALVELIRGSGAGLFAERAVLGSMAAAGIACGFLTAWRGLGPSAIRGALVALALTAAAAPFGRVFAVWLATGVLTGGALGIATVALAAHLRGWCGVGWVGLGTGLGYALCNLPWVFNQSPTVQAWAGAGFALMGAAAVPNRSGWQNGSPAREMSVWAAVMMFAALVWLDSAAFFVIQHVGDMKAGTWGIGMCWRNAAVHLVVAIATGGWLARGGFRMVPMLAWTLLAVAGLAANSAATLPLAGWLYPAGVSLYSTALVAWPGWSSGAADPRATAWRAAWMFAIAGWFASANGIGMAETLRHVPTGFVLGAGAVVIGCALFSDKGGWRGLAGPALVAAAVLTGNALRKEPSASAAARGKQVYLSEGCIHCHSQFIRPDSPDEALWGSAASTANARADVPVLIGNRRQGPDLTNVAARRSDAWLRLHFIQPSQLIPGTPMPSYAHLFRDGRGGDLIAYLRSLAERNPDANRSPATAWTPANVLPPSPENGGRHFARWCATCHGSAGRGDGPLAASLTKKPADLANGPFNWTAGDEQTELRIARIIKFGIPGTDMPGHEPLTDQQAADLARYVSRLRNQPP
ncbi:MAG: cbb3-type cytochrome c oxidase subunit II [Verrucomicrobia bacterium]|nr:cbb3-type cytochrome c oxidase subunit II [Verrucomicrobiota bacterium]